MPVNAEQHNEQSDVVLLEEVDSLSETDLTCIGHEGQCNENSEEDALCVKGQIRHNDKYREE